MTPHEKALLLRVIGELPITTPCHACKSLRGENFCAVWMSEIPPDVLLKGCEKFDFDPKSPPF